MSPTVRVDEEVYASLQARATPFVDTPNSVLRRLLGLGPTQEEAVNDEGAIAEEPSSEAGSGVGTAKSLTSRRRKPQRSGRRGRQKEPKQSRAPSGVLL